jgi:single-strand DNA-binding protein
MSSIYVKGNVGNDPELKFVNTARGEVAVAVFSLAHTAKSKQGNQWVDGDTTWYRITVWGEKAEALVDSVAKGTKVMVWGTLKQGSYTAKDGTQKSSLEINADDVGISVTAKAVRNTTERDEPKW